MTAAPRPDADPPPPGFAEAALELGESAILAVDDVGRICHANPAAGRMLDREAADLRGAVLTDMVLELDAERWTGLWERLRAGGVEAVAARVRRRDDRTVRVEIEVLRVATGDGPLAMVRVRDVSTRIAAERELHASQAMKAAVLDAALDAIVVMDDAGRVVDVNTVAVRTFGWTRDELIGAPLADRLIPAEHRGAHHAGMRRYLDTGVSRVLGRRLELEATCADGSRVPVEIAIQAISIDGRPVFTAYLRDIRDRHAAERALVEARDAAVRASGAKSRFLAGFSHEIRTPMTAIVGYADLLSRDQSDAARRESWRRAIRQNADHLLALIDDVLDVSRAEAGRLALHPTDVEVGQLLDDAVAPFRQRAAERGVALHVARDASLPEWLRIDGTRLRQIVVNLVSNAVRATERGSIELRAGLAGDGAGRRLRVVVRDTGRGIPPEQLEDVFEPFVHYRDESASERGAGMGLAIVRLLVSRMGGRVAVDSTPGQGATFTVELGCEPTAAPPSVLASADDLPSLRGRRLLVVDDNADNRDILCHLLEDAGATCDRAVDGARGAAAAVAATRGGTPFDAVLMDLQMPGLDGYAALAALRADGCAAPVLAVTAFATTEDRARCAAAGFDGFLTKPVVGADLLRAIAALPGLAPEHPAQPAPLRSKMADDPRFLELLERYLDRLVDIRDELRQLREAGDADAVARLAHRIKGTAGSYGYPEITAAAAGCETPLRAGAALIAVAAALDRLDELMARALAGRQERQ